MDIIVICRKYNRYSDSQMAPKKIKKLVCQTSLGKEKYFVFIAMEAHEEGSAEKANLLSKNMAKISN